MTTATVNFAWQMPDPGGSANTWGNTLNATTQAIDAQVFENQQALDLSAPPVGAILMYGGLAPGPNWLLCDGRPVSTTTYATLFAVIGYAFGGSGANFNLPNLQQRFPLGAASGQVGSFGGQVDYNYTIALANLPSHAHPIIDVTHSHTDTGHNHPASQDPHSHTVTIVGDTSTTGVQAGGGPTVGVAGGVSYTTSTSQPNVGIYQGTANLAASGTGLSTTQAAGSGTPMVIVPAFQAVNFIIRYA